MLMAHKMPNNNVEKIAQKMVRKNGPENGPENGPKNGPENVLRILKANL